MTGLPKEVSTTILITIYRRGRITMSELQNETEFSTITVLNHVEALLTAGLIEDEREGTFPRRRILKTSVEGERIATLLNLANGWKNGLQDIIDMGARAGRSSSYRETIAILRNPNITRDYVIAELLLKDLAALSSGLLLIRKGLPDEFRSEAEALERLAAMINDNFKKGSNLLTIRDLRGSVGIVSQVMADYNKTAPLIDKVQAVLKERKLEELCRYLEFLAPKVTQKE